MRDVLIRPMTDADVPEAERISDDAFFALDTAQRVPAAAPPQRRSPVQSGAWEARTRGFLASDPDGSWVAEQDGELVGFATSFRREQVWCLATFAVRPGLQGAGIGARVLDAAVAYGADRPRGMLAASVDPRALRRYHQAGFRLHPQLTLHGAVDRTALPAVHGVREGGADDLAWMDDLDRALRGGPHGPDHERLLGAGRLVVASDRSGYAYTNGRMLALLAARDEDTARTLLWECLASAEERYEAAHVTSANYWAVEVALSARLDLVARGYLGLRGMAPPAPYVHHGALL
ncbi:GNAT family N-acetyltransferase [Nocardioides nitrophenolicus]|uniref:GNAT family N-acetyltransferase n=1 Tax=Nocardioides nitrophenolicus TaxID=60489 RepID=UPI00195688C3|nr:GNAT family N-acetyltransferase [Nocardioides nitrophenolicus]MBM7515417.1 GNAT superfamily N-acetyltransferase [Nocardioides nitrophenolicus]